MQNLFFISFSRNRIEAINHGLGLPESEPAQHGLAIALTVVLVISVVVAAVILLRNVQRHKLNDPHKLFAEICRAHGLSRSQRRVLSELSNARKLKDPCLVLFDAGYWILDPNTDQELCQAKYRSRLVAVQRLLFESDAAKMQAARS